MMDDVPRQRRWDRATVRALIILAIVILCLVAFGTALTLSNRRQLTAQRHFEREVVANCMLLNRAHRTFNAVLDQLSANLKASHHAFPEKRKQEALRAYAHLHLPQQNCPPVP